ncbi:hypothetical protein RF11_02668 [Thelohanellus kitauei]|uniref:Uncharacterized protein n=1 Tax=Thelohanellus kitauei TaxID=669202 RepID=A0A0C2ITW3_THEKT|nr:hypothetical protein RF11_02668 [Thelohanellus kitauei]
MRRILLKINIDSFISGLTKERLYNSRRGDQQIPVGSTAASLFTRDPDTFISMKEIRTFIQNIHLRKLLPCRLQGPAFETIKCNHISIKFISNGGLPAVTYCCIHKATLDVPPTRASACPQNQRRVRLIQLPYMS